ncbi:MAG TPA: caspase family protein [Dongiaceae bacterium]|nr:caspase family protein [Dongiaceae bacterium]
MMQETRLASFLGALMVGLLCSIGAALAEPRVALVIGNSSYGGEIGNLANPANDAKLMAKTLRGIGFDVVEVENADQNAMKRAIVDFGDKLSNAGTDATGLFYYAGHGLQVQGENFLIPVKAHIEREADVDIEAVSADLVLKQMDYAGSAVNIVILDACRNNPLTRGFRSEVRGLAEITRKPRGSFIAYSTAPGEVAADGNGANSPYAKALAESIVVPGEGIEEIFRDVRGKVLAATNSKQTPWDSSSLTAPFYFQAPVAAAPAVGASTALSGNPQAAELLFWESIKDSKSADDFQAYLDKYPQGDFASLAKNRLKSLGAVASAEPEQPDATIRNMAPGKDEEIAKEYEQSFWDSVKDSGRAEDLQAYLNKYPRGQYADMAKQKLKDLGEAATPRLLESVPPPAQVAAVAPPPLPAFDAVDRQIFARDQARLRAAPDMKAEVIGRAAANAALRATGRSQDGAWWRIAMADGRTGYVAASVVTEQPVAAPAAAAPSAPASPAPVATPPAAAPAQEASAAAPSAPPSGKDEDICPENSKAALADRIAACQRVIANAGDDDTKITALINLGNNFYNSGQPDAALKNYQAALAIDPKNAAANFDIGLILSDRARYAEARVAFDKAAQSDPSDVDAVYQRGVMRGNLGDFDGAREDVRRAIALKAGVPDYYNELSFLDLVAGDAAAGAKALDQAGAGDPKFWSTTAFAVYYFDGAMDKALEQAERSIKDSPDYAYGWVWKSLVQRAGGDVAGANQSLADGLKAIKPTDWPTPLLQFMSGKISEERMRVLANSGDLKTRNERLCEVSFYRGELAYLAGDKDTARAAMQVALGTRIYYYVEYAAAKARLARLGQ